MGVESPQRAVWTAKMTPDTFGGPERASEPDLGARWAFQTWLAHSIFHVCCLRAVGIPIGGWCGALCCRGKT